ncbi:MAG: hypothetical protein GY707_14510 [Desulfobacteraceae bacterium]|nr:hypothetical protein [Desulfobacteraceae bacterium]
MSFIFGSKADLDHTILDNFISYFNKKSLKKPETILTGRGLVDRADINGLGPIVIKHYTRGGFVSYVNKDRYLFSNKSRSQLEFNFLLDAIKAGVSVPEPIAYSNTDDLFYKAWLITKEIKNSKNFVELCLNEKDKAVSLLPLICKNINKLLLNSIHHVDLHPGNIILDELDKPFILDFDKACYFSGDKWKLIEKYKTRWQRAITKYKLPDELSYLELK